MADVPAGTIGVVATSDPPGQSFSVLQNPVQAGHSAANNSVKITTAAAGCNFSLGSSSSMADFAWLPSSDIYGNSVNPATAYKPVITTGGQIAITGNRSTDWANAHAAALNVADDAAYRARTNATLPVYVFTIGYSASVDNVLLQRFANDPSWLTSADCTRSGLCVNYPSQPQGRYVFAANKQELMQAFLSLSSATLRLSQ